MGWDDSTSEVVGMGPGSRESQPVKNVLFRLLLGVYSNLNTLILINNLIIIYFDVFCMFPDVTDNENQLFPLDRVCASRRRPFHRIESTTGASFFQLNTTYNVVQYVHYML